MAAEEFSASLKIPCICTASAILAIYFGATAAAHAADQIIVPPPDSATTEGPGCHLAGKWYPEGTIIEPSPFGLWVVATPVICKAGQWIPTHP